MRAISNYSIKTKQKYNKFKTKCPILNVDLLNINRNIKNTSIYLPDEYDCMLTAEILGREN
ncbi:MAG: hypothetical protein PHN69_07690 [Candidatus Pacebacteria bacterium]|nr:hypothetical protein [Candidatus Paceibacterota bacterium]